jgi:hypothetical protein
VLSFDFTTTNPCYPELGCRLQQPEQPALPLISMRLVMLASKDTFIAPVNLVTILPRAEHLTEKEMAVLLDTLKTN